MGIDIIACIEHVPADPARKEVAPFADLSLNRDSAFFELLADRSRWWPESPLERQIADAELIDLEGVAHWRASEGFHGPLYSKRGLPPGLNMRTITCVMEMHKDVPEFDDPDSPIWQRLRAEWVLDWQPPESEACWGASWLFTEELAEVVARRQRVPEAWMATADGQRVGSSMWAPSGEARLKKELLHLDAEPRVFYDNPDPWLDAVVETMRVVDRVLPGRARFVYWFNG